MLPDRFSPPIILLLVSLNAPTGAWCSLTFLADAENKWGQPSQCTYRCVVLPDYSKRIEAEEKGRVSMHLQVRGAP